MLEADTPALGNVVGLASRRRRLPLRHGFGARGMALGRCDGEALDVEHASSSDEELLAASPWRPEYSVTSDDRVAARRRVGMERIETLIDIEHVGRAALEALLAS